MSAHKVARLSPFLNLSSSVVFVTDAWSGAALVDELDAGVGSILPKPVSR
jgi:hypothetical protein